MIFLIFHFYLLLQLEGLSEKAGDYNQLLNETLAEPVDRRRARWRLDDFPFLQFLAGVRERRTGVAGKLQILISWITIVLFPIVVLLQLQIVFLPYHSISITWLHRACLIGDLGLVWLFWRAFRRNIEPGRRRRIAVVVVASTGTLLVLIFSLSLATFPGEVMYRNKVANAVDMVVTFVLRNPAVSASKSLFEGDVDGVTGLPSSLFANRIILPDERFYDESKKTSVSVSLRGRDLRSAILSRTDLSQADFTGATLVEASFVGAKLQQTRFGCAASLQLKTAGRSRRRGRCDEESVADLRGADFSDGVLHGSLFNDADLRGARFARTMAQGASFDNADLTGATFTYARLEGASFVNATLTGGTLVDVQMQGADLRYATLSNATLVRTQLQGARLGSVRLTNAALGSTNLYRAFVNLDGEEDTVFARVHADPAFPLIRLPSQRKDPEVEQSPKVLDAGGYRALVSRAQERIQNDEVRNTIAARLQPLDPARKAEEGQLVTDKPIMSGKDVNEKVHVQRAEAFAELMCDKDGAPYIARSYIYSGRLRGMANRFQDAAHDPALRIIATLRAAGCPGALGLDANDLRELDWAEAQVWAIRNRIGEARPDDGPAGFADR